MPSGLPSVGKRNFLVMQFVARRQHAVRISANGDKNAAVAITRKRRRGLDYNDPTNATNPPGGKHHETQKEGKKLPTNRHEHKKDKGKKSVSPDTVAKTER
jgi:hypothetical protein